LQFHSEYIAKLPGRKIREFTKPIIDCLGNFFTSIAYMDWTGYAGDEVDVTLAILIKNPDPFAFG
jgi:hypothetical protein